MTRWACLRGFVGSLGESLDEREIVDRSELKEMSAARGKLKTVEGKTSHRWGLGIGAMLGLLVIFSSVVAAVTYSLRWEIRQQLISVDSHVLSLLVQNQIERAEQEAGLVFRFESLSELDVWAALLETATADGVFAVQLYGLDGSLRQSSSERIMERSLSDAVESTVSSGTPLTQFREDVWLSRYVDIGFEDDVQISVSDIYLPLFDSDGRQVLGVARYLMDGSVLAGEFDALDGKLTKQASVAIALGGLAILVLFGLALLRLGVENRRVLQHAERLRRANAELAMLAKTSAVGSVTAHLIHGLKNPLAGLRQVVGGSGSVGELKDDELADAREATERMQRMVEEVVGVLQDIGTGAGYQLTVAEILEELERRFRRDAESAGVALRLEGDDDALLDSQTAGIVLLIASNLVKNALEAVEEGGDVSVRFEAVGKAFFLTVADSGQGISEDRRDTLFAPVKSSKSGGAGIGLAISRQLARFLGGDLQLLDTGRKGATFELSFPCERQDAEKD